MNVFISPTLGVPPVLVKTLREQGFTFMLLQQGERNPIKSKVGLGLDFLKDSWVVVRQLTKLRQANTIVVNSYVALTVMGLHKLGFIRYQQLLYFGFFLHSPRYYPLFRWLFSRILTAQDTLLVFSRHEVSFYESTLRLQPGNVAYAPLPYQVTDELPSAAQLPANLPDAYYFAGGYTNRDYAGLIQVFRSRSEHLVICGSDLNDDLAVDDLPANVLVFKDLSRSAFKALVAQARACLLPIKDDTGAAGQSFVLEAMAYRKIVVATQTRVLTELIEQGKTGFLLTSMVQQLPGLLDAFQKGKYDVQTMGEWARQTVLEFYSEEAFADALNRIMSMHVITETISTP